MRRIAVVPSMLVVVLCATFSFAQHGSSGGGGGGSHGGGGSSGSSSHSSGSSGASHSSSSGSHSQGSGHASGASSAKSGAQSRSTETKGGLAQTGASRGVQDVKAGPGRHPMPHGHRWFPFHRRHSRDQYLNLTTQNWEDPCAPDIARLQQQRAMVDQRAQEMQDNCRVAGTACVQAEAAYQQETANEATMTQGLQGRCAVPSRGSAARRKKP